MSRVQHSAKVLNSIDAESRLTKQQESRQTIVTNLDKPEVELIAFPRSNVYYRQVWLSISVCVMAQRVRGRSGHGMPRR